MARKPTYEELAQRVRDLEKGTLRDGVADSGAQDARTANALEALRQSEEMVQLLLNASSDAIHLLDLNGNFLVLNEITARRFGRTVEELKGTCAWDLLPPDVARARKAWFEEVIREGKPVKVEDQRHGRWIDNRVFPIFDERGDVGKVGVFARDTTERKRMEEDLEKERAFLRRVIDAVPCLICVKTEEGRFALANKGLAVAYGTTVADLEGKSDNDFSPTPEEAAAFRRDDLEVIRGRRTKMISEEKITYADGTTHWLSTIKLPLTHADGTCSQLLAVATDITERKTAEDARRESEERYRNFIANASEGIFRIDLTRPVYVDEPREILEEKIAQCAIVGEVNAALADMYKLSPEQMTGLPVREFAPNCGAQMADLLGTKDCRIIDREEIEYTAEGHRIHIVESYIGIVDKGILKRVWGVQRDVTERERMEEALRQSEERWQFALEGAGDGVWDWNAQTNEVFFSHQWKAMLGFEDDEIGNTLDEWDKRVHPDDREQAYADLNRHFSGLTPLYVNEHRVLCKDGTYKWILDRGKVISWTAEGRPSRVIGTHTDISEHKAAEQALRKSEERYRNILGSIEEGYYEVDVAGNFTFFNDSVCELLGYSRDELMGMNDRQYTEPESARKLFRAFNEVYRTGKPTKGFDWEVIRKDGTRRFVEASVSLMRDTEGKPTGFRGITRDVTVRKEAEKERERLEAQLQQARKLEAIGTLAGGLAHDFNNLLMGIQGRTSLMLMDTDASHPHLEHLRGIEEYVKSAADLTGQLLGFARGGRYEVKPTDLNELADKSATLFGRTRKEISIFRKFQPGLRSVDVDQHQIEQVLLNLFVNAWQAMPAGGDLYLQTENVVLEEHDGKSYDLKPGPYVKLAVTDTGVGMDDATRQRIFDPFFTTKEMGRGTGLGLASAYGIVRNHRGVITAYSEKGYGSTFSIYLPASEKGVSAEKEPAAGPVKGEGTVLLVDDEEMILEVGRPMLENLGYAVLEARSGKEAVEIYRQNKDRIRVVVLDMVMPRMSGEQTFDQLKAVNPNVRVLLSSGYSVNGRAQEILDRGCDGFIQKPFSYSDLSRKLSEILQKG